MVYKNTNNTPMNLNQIITHINPREKKESWYKFRAAARPELNAYWLFFSPSPPIFQSSLAANSHNATQEKIQTSDAILFPFLSLLFDAFFRHFLLGIHFIFLFFSFYFCFHSVLFLNSPSASFSLSPIHFPFPLLFDINAFALSASFILLLAFSQSLYRY